MLKILGSKEFVGMTTLLILSLLMTWGVWAPYWIDFEIWPVLTTIAYCVGAISLAYLWIDSYGNYFSAHVCKINLASIVLVIGLSLAPLVGTELGRVPGGILGVLFTVYWTYVTCKSDT